MNSASRSNVLELLKYESSLCVSLYMPTHRAGRETLQDPIRFKNLLKEAYAKACIADEDSNLVRGLLEPLESKLQESDFWQHQDRGLAVFRSPEILRWIQTWWAVPELCVVGRSFHLKPLMRILNSQENFFVLCVSGQGVRLFHGDHDGLEEITPDAIAEIFEPGIADRRRGGLQMHSAGVTVYHGPGSVTEAEQAILSEQFRRADREIAIIVAASEFPVILAGVESTKAVYRPLCSFPHHLLKDELAGNCGVLPAQDLWKGAWPLVTGHFRRLENAAMASFDDLLARNMASTDLAAIFVALSEGRIDKLFVAVGRQVWGCFDSASGRIKISNVQLPDDIDLLDEAASRALAQGGKVYALSADRMPTGAVAAGVFRY